ncbi:hypothetical protein BC332_34714 [Capsicum chinense]|nr:hypothetical protein BC332_34714 [Capsicum chinense]
MFRTPDSAKTIQKSKTSLKAGKKSGIKEDLCGKCKKKVLKDEPGIQCEGCDKWYHTKCVEMSARVYDLLSTSEAEWKCICSVSQIKPGDTNGLIQLLLQKLINLEVTISAVTDVIKEFNDLKACCEVLKDRNQVLEEKLDKIGKNVLSLSSKLNSPAKGSRLPETGDKGVPYSKVGLVNVPDLIIMPNNTDKGERNVLSELRQNVKPADIEVVIRSVKSLKSGGVVIKADDQAATDKLHKHLSEKLTDVSIKVTNLRKPRIFLSGLAKCISTEEFCEEIKQQNYGISNDDHFKNVGQMQIC